MLCKIFSSFHCCFKFGVPMIYLESCTGGRMLAGSFDSFVNRLGWFSAGDLGSVLSYLLAKPQLFTGSKIFSVGVKTQFFGMYLHESHVGGTRLIPACIFTYADFCVPRSRQICRDKRRGQERYEYSGPIYRKIPKKFCLRRRRMVKGFREGSECARTSILLWHHALRALHST